MAKLGVITDGISRDFEHALHVMTENGLQYAELQYLWDKEVGDLNDDEMSRAKDLVQKYGVKVSCISRHNFAGMAVGSVDIGDENYQKHFNSLKRCIAMAKEFDTKLVRIMSYRKEMIIFGSHGVEVWNISKGAWDKFKELMKPLLQLAEEEDVTLVVETGNNAMITSASLGRRLIDELGSKRLQVLWDPGNSLFCNELPFPDAYQALQGGYLGHIHMKDVVVDIPNATVRNTALGEGQMTPYLEKIAAGLMDDQYSGVVSFESVYHPGDGSFENGFCASVDQFKQVFG